ncbi:hypothetical protein LTR36_001554 [Oleoguttula mirabilis]|uniref:Uncharacterized protein n=1 Tax=Oleoguttula mirabilis TaxID=1507867 RepID=A0AAV9JMP6_9PEZI|nr:hypothetical protein LTR36_001554 [Oleoguttula mirabilis]
MGSSAGGIERAAEVAEQQLHSDQRRRAMEVLVEERAVELAGVSWEGLKRREQRAVWRSLTMRWLKKCKQALLTAGAGEQDERAVRGREVETGSGRAKQSPQANEHGEGKTTAKIEDNIAVTRTVREVDGIRRLQPWVRKYTSTRPNDEVRIRSLGTPAVMDVAAKGAQVNNAVHTGAVEADSSRAEQSRHASKDRKGETTAEVVETVAVSQEARGTHQRQHEREGRLRVPFVNRIRRVEQSRQTSDDGEGDVTVKGEETAPALQIARRRDRVCRRQRLVNEQPRIRGFDGVFVKPLRRFGPSQQPGSDGEGKATAKSEETVAASQEAGEDGVRQGHGLVTPRPIPRRIGKVFTDPIRTHISSETRTMQREQQIAHGISKSVAASRKPLEGYHLRQHQRLEGIRARIRPIAKVFMNPIRRVQLSRESRTMRWREQIAHGIWKTRLLARARARGGESASQDVWEMMREASQPGASGQAVSSAPEGDDALGGLGGAGFDGRGGVKRGEDRRGRGMDARTRRGMVQDIKEFVGSGRRGGGVS